MGSRRALPRRRWSHVTGRCCLDCRARGRRERGGEVFRDDNMAQDLIADQDTGTNVAIMRGVQCLDGRAEFQTESPTFLALLKKHAKTQSAPIRSAAASLALAVPWRAKQVHRRAEGSNPRRRQWLQRAGRRGLRPRSVPRHAYLGRSATRAPDPCLHGRNARRHPYRASRR
jgi:hypothetical protein